MEYFKDGEMVHSKSSLDKQRNHFTLFDTETEGEAVLRAEIRDLRGELSQVLDAIVGLTVVLEERYGIDVVTSDEDFNAD